MLEGSLPTDADLRSDIASVPSLPPRYYLLKRPEQRLTYAFTPTVHEYRVTEEKLEKYVSDATADYLTPDEIDSLLAQPLIADYADDAPSEKTADVPSATPKPSAEIPPDDFYY